MQHDENCGGGGRASRAFRWLLRRARQRAAKKVAQAEVDARYNRREILGRGTFGTVYRVVRAADAAELAAKVIISLLSV